jgi:hypothetical protein
MAPVHQKCAIAKTIGEAPVKARTDRLRANFLGIKKKSKWPKSKWKRKFDGSVVRREE